MKRIALIFTGLIIFCPFVFGLGEMLDPVSKGDGFAYYEVNDRPFNKQFIAKMQKANGNVNFAEFGRLDSARFRTVRVFADLHQKELQAEGLFSRKCKLHIRVFHNTKTASSSYAEKEIVFAYTTGDCGYIDVPVIGTSMRILIDGENIPETDVRLTVSIYFLR